MARNLHYLSQNITHHSHFWACPRSLANGDCFYFLLMCWNWLMQSSKWLYLLFFVWEVTYEANRVVNISNLLLVLRLCNIKLLIINTLAYQIENSNLYWKNTI